MGPVNQAKRALFPELAVCVNSEQQTPKCLVKLLATKIYDVRKNRVGDRQWLYVSEGVDRNVAGPASETTTGSF
jgi:hypothetical protein